MNAHKMEAVVTEDGTLLLRGLPFHAGTLVEVIVLENSGLSQEQSVQSPLASIPYSLQGTVIRYDDPFGSAVPLEDWEALT